MKKIISSILIAVGFIFILSPFVNNRIIESRSNTTQKIVKQVTAEEIEENDNQEAIYEYEAIKDIEITSTITGTIDMKKEEINKNIIGQIIIDDLNIDLPILKGVSNANLLIGAGTMVPDLVMGKGNYSLAGHYMKDNLLFGRLIEIEIGTIVKLTNKKIVYEYIIYDTQIVSDTSFYMLNQSRSEDRGKPIISLMTCYYTSKNGKRFFALGELVREYPYDETRDFNEAKNKAEAHLTSAAAADKGDVFILAPNDGTARSIADTFTADTDVTSFVITGQDAEKASVQYIIDGKQTMTVFKDVRSLVKDSIGMAVSILDGKTPETTGSYNNKTTDVPAKQTEVIVVDQANVKASLVDSGYYEASEFTNLK